MKMVFEKMQLTTPHKYDSLRTLIFEVLHFLLKQPHLL